MELRYIALHCVAVSSVVAVMRRRRTVGQRSAVQCSAVSKRDHNDRPPPPPNFLSRLRGCMNIVCHPRLPLMQSTAFDAVYPLPQVCTYDGL